MKSWWRAMRIAVPAAVFLVGLGTSGNLPASPPACATEVPAYTSSGGTAHRYSTPATPDGTMLAYWAAVGRHDGKAAYLLLSPSLRRSMAANGAGPTTLTMADRHILSLSIDKWREITPLKARTGARREYMLILRLHIGGTTSWVEGLNVRYVLVIPGTQTPWAIGEIAAVPIPL